MTGKSLSDHLFGAGPKRILALDGGGIRGILTLQFLHRIEKMVRQRTGNNNALLCDYFDLVGGTSTGAIIAAAIATGREVQHIEDVYRDLGDKIFRSRFFRKGLLRPKFSAEPVKEALQKEFGDIRLGGPELKTGLAVVAKRIDTGSPWVFHNNPKGKYFDRRPGSQATPNKDYLLRDVVRASTAAPTYFEPEQIRVTRDVEGAFVDGGVSPHNNPALELLMLGTLKGHAINWPMGENNIQIVSLGTGSKAAALDAQTIKRMPAAELGIRSLTALMDDASALNETLLQWMSSTPTARKIDSERGDLAGDILSGGAPLLTYLRYDASFDDPKIARLLTPEQLDIIIEMDVPGNMDKLVEIGKIVAAEMKDEHFSANFNI